MNTSHVIRGMQITMTMRHHYTPNRMAEIQTTDNSEDGEPQELSFMAQGNAKWHGRIGREFDDYL